MTITAPAPPSAQLGPAAYTAYLSSYDRYLSAILKLASGRPSLATIKSQGVDVGRASKRVEEEEAPESPPDSHPKSPATKARGSKRSRNRKARRERKRQSKAQPDGGEKEEKAPTYVPPFKRDPTPPPHKTSGSFSPRRTTVKFDVPEANTTAETSRLKRTIKVARPTKPRFLTHDALGAEVPVFGMEEFEDEELQVSPATTAGTDGGSGVGEGDEWSTPTAARRCKKCTCVWTKPVYNCPGCAVRAVKGDTLLRQGDITVIGSKTRIIAEDMGGLDWRRCHHHSIRPRNTSPTRSTSDVSDVSTDPGVRAARIAHPGGGEHIFDLGTTPSPDT